MEKSPEQPSSLERIQSIKGHPHFADLSAAIDTYAHTKQLSVVNAEYFLKKLNEVSGHALIPSVEGLLNDYATIADDRNLDGEAMRNELSSTIGERARGIIATVLGEIA